MYDFLESCAEPIRFDFTDKKIEATSLENVIRAACTYSNPRANSWICCVNCRDIVNGIARAAFNHPQIKNAPVLFVYFDCDPTQQKPDAKALKLLEVNDEDASRQFAALAIKAAGMQVKVVQDFDAFLVRQILGLPASLRPRTILSFGHYI